MTEPLSRADRLKAIMTLYGVGQGDAEFIMAIEDDEIDGDVVELDADGNEVRRAPERLKANDSPK